MAANDDDPFGLLIRKLERLAALDEDDRQAIRALPFKLRTSPANRYLVREGDDTSECCLLLAGYACRHKLTSDGARQIVSFHLPGDILDLQHLLLTRADHNLQTITEATTAWLPAEEIKKLAQERRKVGEALWRDTLIDASIFREWVLNVGRRDARSRIAHMLCEFAARRDAAGLGGPESFELPMTQEEIGDATGMTAVHVNRMLHDLQAEGVISRDKRQVEILNWNKLRQIAGFDPQYLHAAA
jgi:CRP-like cAMP-binding protein